MTDGGELSCFIFGNSAARSLNTLNVPSFLINLRATYVSTAKSAELEDGSNKSWKMQLVWEKLLH